MNIKNLLIASHYAIKQTHELLTAYTEPEPISGAFSNCTKLVGRQIYLI